MRYFIGKILPFLNLFDLIKIKVSNLKAITFAYLPYFWVFKWKKKKICTPLRSSSWDSFFAFLISCLHFGTLSFCQQSSQVNAWPYFCLALVKPWSDNTILFSGFSFFPQGTILQGQPACPAYEHVENPLLCTNDFQMGNCCWKSSQEQQLLYCST